MRAHIVLAHPENQSFNAQLAGLSEEVLRQAGWQTRLSDLYAMDFDPREGPRHYDKRKNPDAFHVQTEQRHNADNGSLPAEIEAEMQNLLHSDLLIVHFPLWWFGMPAILKGWMDRVFVYGRMYRSAVRYDHGICVGKKMIACMTTGADADSCAHNGREGDSQLHLWPILFPFRYLGYNVYQPEVLHGVGGVAFIEGQDGGASTLQTYLDRWSQTIESLDSRPFIRYNHEDEFDDSKRLRPGSGVYSPFVRHNPDAV